MADEQLYKVQAILDRKWMGRNVFYLVRWVGFSPEHDTWEPCGNLTACRRMIAHFLDKHNDGEKNTKPRSQKTVDNTMPTDKLKTGGVKRKSKQMGKMRKESVLSAANQKNNKKSMLNKRANLIKGRYNRGKLVNSRHPNLLGKKKQMMLAGGEISSVLNLDADLKSSQKQGSIVDIGDDSTKQSTSHIMKDHRKRKHGPETVKKHSNKGNQKKLGSDRSAIDIIVKKIKREKKICLVDEDDEDDDILYSLSADCDTTKATLQQDAPRVLSKGVGFVCKDTKKKGKKVPSLETIQEKETTKKTGGKNNSLSLMKSKKNSNKDWISKSGIFRSVSPPPVFTSVKHLMGSLDTQDPSKPSGNFLPDPVSPEASETYLADVPSSFPVPGTDEHLTDTEDQPPRSASSLMYESFLDSLPEQFHQTEPAYKPVPEQFHQTEQAYKPVCDKQVVRPALLGGPSSMSNSGLRGIGGDSVERRTSVRTTECAFRYKQIVVKKCFRYTQIWLNTQSVMKNALNPQVIQEVVSALNSAKYDDSHLVLFSSLGSVFCSGTDLHFLISNDRKVAARQMADSIRDLTKTFITFPKPIIAAVSGAAVGMGVSLLALCDIVYASDKASFHLPYSQLSQTPEGASSFTLPLTLGLPSANELLYGGRKITAMEAYNLGLVSQVFWPTLMMQEVIPRAQNMASSSAKALEATKLLIRSHHRTKMELTNETECNLLLERWLSQDCQRAIEIYLSNEKNLIF